MNILFIGDIAGNTGRWVVSRVLTSVREEFNIDLCVANGENIAGGRGITVNLLGKLKHYGVVVITSGNHIWDNKDIYPALKSNDTMLRPHNYPEGNPGKGATIFTLESGLEVGILNLQGRTFMYNIDCPFKIGLQEVEKMRERTPIIFVDMHAETTSEKIALGWYLDGKVSAVVGTHTHVQTADDRILPGGTGYLTDVGMTGPWDSVIGVKKELAIRRFLSQAPVRFEPADENPLLSAVVIEIDENTGKATRMERILRTIKKEPQSSSQ